jgi:GT2 family glycosyltransferase
MMVAVIVVNYYTSSLLRGLCSSLKRQDFLSELIIVNNSHEEFSVVELSEEAGIPVRVLQNDTNLGFGAAVNRAFGIIEADYALIINPDARLLQGCVKAMVEACEKYYSPLAGPRFYWDDEKLFRLPPATGDSMWFGFGTESAGHFDLDAQLFSFYWALRHDRFWSMDEPFFEPFLSGACLLVRVDWIRKMKNILFDERFFLYYEDTDLCARALARGIKPLCVPGAEAIHYWDQSPEPPQSKTKLMDKARVLFMDKHYGRSARECRIMARDKDQKGDIPCKISEQLDLSVDLQSLGHDCPGAYLEIGLNRHFVPFAQTARTIGPGLTSKLRESIPPGRYFVRIRHEDHGILRVWKWEK